MYHDLLFLRNTKHIVGKALVVFNRIPFCCLFTRTCINKNVCAIVDHHNNSPVLVGINYHKRWALINKGKQYVFFPLFKIEERLGHHSLTKQVDGVIIVLVLLQHTSRSSKYNIQKLIFGRSKKF